MYNKLRLVDNYDALQTSTFTRRDYGSRDRRFRVPGIWSRY